MKPEILDALEFCLLQEAAESRWLVQVIKAGESLNGNVYSPEVLREAVPLFEDRPVSVYDVGGGRTSHLPPKVRLAAEGGLIQATVGVLTNARWDEERQAIVAEANVTAPWFAETLKRIGAAVKGPIRTFGLSIAATVEAVADGAKRMIQRFRWVDSVDVVTSPAAGGEFVAALEAVAEGMETMDEQKIRALIAEALKGLTPLSEERVNQLVAEAVKGASTQIEAERAAVTEALKVAKEAKEQADKIVAEAVAEKLNTRTRGLVEIVMKGFARETQDAAVRLVVSESKPEDNDDTIRGRVKAFADPLPKPQPAPRPGRVQVVQESSDKLKIAMAGLCGVMEDDEAKAGVTPFRSLAQAYVQYTGNPDALYGEPFVDLRRQGLDALRQGVTEDVQLSTSFTVALGTSMHKRLLKAYRRPGWGEQRLLSPQQNLTNFKIHHMVRIGGFGDIPTVSEAAEYLTGTNPTEEAPYMQAAKKGRLLEVSWEKILADDIRVITREVDQLGLAARRTFAHAVFAMLHDNPTWNQDSKALFHADHANLTTNALAYATIIAGADALWNQTEQDSGAKLLIDVRQGGLLIIPKELEDTAYEIMSWAEKPGAATYGNQIRAMFGTVDNPMERVILDPFTTDATDWFMLANPAEYDCIVPGYLNGRSEPELLSAEAEQAYAMWYKEVLQYKIRFVWALGLADYRPAYGAYGVA